MPRPIHATVHLSALTHNLRQIRQQTRGAKIWSVVKANAYGHGLGRVWPALKETDGFALLDIDEAILLRKQGWEGPILLLEGFFQAQDLALIDQYRLTTVIHCEHQLQMLQHAPLSQPLDIYLKVNSGMHRLGFMPEDLMAAYHSARALPHVGQVTLMTHFANADNHLGVEPQLAAFNAACADISAPRCLANSAAVLWHPHTHADWVRPGIVLYGASPTGRWQDIADANLRPAMSLNSEIIAIQNMATGDAIGYGSRYQANQPQRIGIVACGYADGYPRHAPSGTPVWVNGTRTSLLGAVSMDMLAVDLSELPDAQIGTPVELWGQNLPVDDVAQSAGTIGYELLCAVAQRVPVIIR